MGLPLSFLLGLLLLIAHDATEWSLPGAGSWSVLLALSPLLALPAWLAHRTWRAAFAELRRTGQDPIRVVRRLRLVPLWIAGVYALLLFAGHLPDLVLRIAGRSHFVQLAGLAGPLLLMELGVHAVQRAHAPRHGVEQLVLLGFLLLPFALVTLLLDLLIEVRELEVFVLATSLGRLAGGVSLVLLLSLLLPLAFRWLLPTSRLLPGRHEASVAATVAALGFPRRSVLALDSGHRLVNAALVGPLRWPRYLILSDGILSLLEPFALRGVVAHEVAHARAGHPALLALVFVVIPLLLLQPVLATDTGDLDPSWVLVALVVVLPLGLLLVRALAHRCEHEADLLAAQALGGADACIEALLKVGELVPGAVHERSLRHPTTIRRVDLLLRAEREPGFVRRFWRRGRAMRFAVLATLLCAAAVSAAHEIAAWPLDRVVWSLRTGRFDDAALRLAALTPVDSPDEQAQRERLAREIALARELAPAGGSWPELAARFGDAGVRRGLDHLRAGDTTSASACFSLALADPAATPLVESLQRYAVALDDGDDARAARLRAHILTLAPPPDVQAALGG